MRLTTLSLSLAGALLLGGLTVTTTFIVISNKLEDAAQGMRVAIESVYVAEELEVALLLHNRNSLLYSVTGREEYHDSAVNHALTMRELISQARAFVTSPEESHNLARAEDAVNAYFDKRQALEDKQVDPLAAYQRTSDAMDNAYLALENIVNVNRADADEMQKEAEAADRLADRLGITAALVLAVLAVAVVLLGQRLIVAPIRRLQRSAELFGQGNFAARAPVGGPYELRQTAERFNEMADAICRGREGQLRFLASIAHDLRNPLSAIRMSAELLALDDSAPPEERKELLEVVSRQATRLDRMVGDLLDVSRIEAGHLQLRKQSQDLVKIVNECAKLYDVASTSHAIDVETPATPLPCDCDGDRISQVLNNLLSNAVKYSPLGGHIHVKAARVDGEIVVSVADEGIGVAADELGRIFEPFKRSKATVDTIPGIGLGLSASRKIVERHGGRIVVDSTLGKGSVFSVVLPVAAQGTTDSATQTT